MKRVLIIVDMQNDFVGGLLGSDAAKAVIPRIQARIADFRAAKDQVVFTMDTHRESDYTAGEWVEMQRIPPHCLKGTEGWKIVEELAAQPGETVEKPAFLSLELPAVIGGGEESDLRIELCGVCTDICVVSNALYLRAKYPRAQIVVHADSCAGTSDQAHQAALTVMRSCLIEVKGGEFDE